MRNRFVHILSSHHCIYTCRYVCGDLLMNDNFVPRQRVFFSENKNEILCFTSLLIILLAMVTDVLRRNADEQNLSTSMAYDNCNGGQDFDYDTHGPCQVTWQLFSLFFRMGE